MDAQAGAYESAVLDDDCGDTETRETRETERGRLVPLSDRIVVMLDYAAGGIVKRGKVWTVQEEKKPMFGTVIAVGPGRTTEAGCISEVDESITEGARICFGRYSGVEVEVNGEPFHLIRETDVLAVLER